jgi:lipopolysaccharide/colanic/teichoic acid biosynthesis glycosyltransferase
MSVFPLVIDSRPAYLTSGGSALSVGLMPVGSSTILGRIGEALSATTHQNLRLVTTFDPTDDYRAAVNRAVGSTDRLVAAADFQATLCEYEPSDWLLILDPLHFPSAGFEPERVLHGMFDGPACATHLVALDENTAGTKDQVEFDAGGRVRKIQRYYDAITWSVASGVVCSLLPVASLAKVRSVPMTSLSALRSALAAQGVPSRDLPTQGGVYDLSREAGLLALTEHLLSDRTRTSGADVVVGRDTRIHESARLVGAVVVQDEAAIEAGATIVGPAVVGAGATVGAGAILAQCVIAPGALVDAGARHRSRVVTGGQLLPAAPDEFSTFTPGEVTTDELSAHGNGKGWYPRIKVVLESAAALLGLLLLSPLFAIIAALIRLESRGPIFYGDLRETRGGRVFKCYKFRTMFVGAAARQRELMNANQMDGPQFKIDHDPRVTRVGRWLRAISFDEFPQLMNVVLGQMSLVGPRPSPFRENQLCVPWREARLSVRPGITGLWQVCRNRRGSGDFHQWISYDLQYVRHMSLLVDVKIIVATVVTLGGKSHVPLSWIIGGQSSAH